jgi:hypothetical protein
MRCFQGTFLGCMLRACTLAPLHKLTVCGSLVYSHVAFVQSQLGHQLVWPLNGWTNCGLDGMGMGGGGSLGRLLGCPLAAYQDCGASYAGHARGPGAEGNEGLVVGYVVWSGLCGWPCLAGASCLPQLACVVLWLSEDACTNILPRAVCCCAERWLCVSA